MKALEDALRFINSEKYKKAERSLEKFIRERPNDANAHNLMGFVRYQAGNLDGALSSFIKTTQIDPRNPDFHTNCGSTLRALGRQPDALASYDEAVRLNPRHALAHSNRGLILTELRRFSEALESLEKAILLNPTDSISVYNKAMSLHGVKRLKEALESFDRSIFLKPDFAEAFNNRGVTLQELDRLDESLRSFDKAIALQPNYAEAFNNRGVTLHKLRRFDDALQNYDKAIALRPKYVEAFNNRGLTLHELRRFDEALQSYEKATNLQPSYAAAFNNRGLVLQELRCLDAALSSYDKAIALNPNHVEAFNNRGNVLKDLRLLDEALRSYDKAVELNPDYAVAFNNRGIALQELRRLDEALKSYDKAIALAPDYVDACFARALLSLLNSNFDQGWIDYEWRRKLPEFSAIQSSSSPFLESFSNLKDKVVFVQSEQGLGDTIQFSRYLLMLIEAGARVFFSPQKQLRTLMSSLNDRITIVDATEAVPYIDFHIFLMSFPGILSTQLDYIPRAVPYLKADTNCVRLWNARIGSHGFKIGICWQGSVNKVDAGRSFPVSLFKEISRISDVRLISLHKGDGEKQLTELPDGMSIELLGEHFDSGDQAFLDTAAVMMSLDLVITSDTAIAHLAGALGIPVWVALKYVPDWRWMLDREDSPWYPTMRLFRQQVLDDWKGVFGKIEMELRTLMRQR